MLFLTMLNSFQPNEYGDQPGHAADAAAQATDSRRSASQKSFMQLAGRYCSRTFAMAMFCLSLVLFPASCIRAQEQYVVVNIAPGGISPKN